MDKLLGPDVFKNLMSKDLHDGENEGEDKLTKVLDNDESNSTDQDKSGIAPGEGAQNDVGSDHDVVTSDQKEGKEKENHSGNDQPGNDVKKNDYIRWQIKDGVAELTGSEPDMDILLGSAITVASTITGKGRHDFCTKCCRLFGWDLSQLNNDIKNGNITQEEADDIMAKSVVDQCQFFLDLVNKEEPSSYSKETFSDERVTPQDEMDDKIAEEEDDDN